MDNPFYFNLARISAAQILRAAGIDRTKPSTLDILTDILIRYLHLLGTQSMAFATTAQCGEASIRDVRTAMEDIGVIAKGRLVSRKRLKRIIKERRGEWEEEYEEDSDPDGEDENDESTESLDKLLDWFKGPQAAECRRVAGVVSLPSTVAGGLVNGMVIPTGGALSGEMNFRPTYVAEHVTSIAHYLRLAC